jgi:hypothetical protein
MKLSGIARYWAAKELTRIERATEAVAFHSPFACPDFTVRLEIPALHELQLRINEQATPLKEVFHPLKLTSGTWCREGHQLTACIALPKGSSRLEFKA